MRYRVRAGHRDSTVTSSDPNEITLGLTVAAGDFPYSISFDSDNASAACHVVIDYGQDKPAEPTESRKLDSEIVVVYGKRTGRIYELSIPAGEIRNTLSFDKLLDRLDSSTDSGETRRFRKNLELGQRLLARTIQLESQKAV